MICYPNEGFVNTSLENFNFVLRFWIPQPAEYGAEEFYSRRCPDAGVGAGFGRGMIGWLLGGEESCRVTISYPRTIPVLARKWGAVCYPGLLCRVGGKSRLAPCY